MKLFEERYFCILKQVVLATDASVIEVHLAEAFELGRAMVEQHVPPDEVTRVHHEAMVQLAVAHPALVLAQVADRLSTPLMEMSMAYGMAFREQMERRYESQVNARLEQSNKLEAVGTLAAGIAHDFNNLLGSIIGFAELAGDELPAGSSGQHSLQQVLTASFRARDLVTRMLTFARQGQHKPPDPVELVSQMREALELLSVSYRPDMELSFQSSIERAMVLADPGQLQQIVMNLCINAADAMNHQGVLVVRIDHATLDDSQHPKGKPAVCLMVLDCGHGMPPEVQARIFDPFFTTKEPGKGSGLGLSVVHGIVTQLGGGIEVKSRVAGCHHGTQFSVRLPLASVCAIDEQNVLIGEI